MTSSEIIELIKLHDKRKKYLSKTFNITMKDIQADIDKLIQYLKSRNSLSLSKSDIIEFSQKFNETFFYKFFDWDKDSTYRELQCNIIIGDKSVLFSSNNEMILITPKGE